MKIGIFVQRCFSLNPTQEKMRKIFVLTAERDGRVWWVYHPILVAERLKAESRRA